MLSSFLVYFGIQGSKLKKERNNTASYDKEKKILRVYQCNPILKTSIAIEPIKHFSIHNTPTKTHFGAVTVGGVTTGGTYTTGGQRVINTTDKSGYYRLVWTGEVANKNESFEIKTINITKEMYEKAKTSNIKDYIIEEKGEYSIVVVRHIQLSYTELKGVMATFEYSSDAQDKLNQGHPNYEKCKAIVDWLSSSDN